MPDDREAAAVAAFQGRAKKNLSRLSSWRRREGVSCFRLYDRDMPELPLAVDVFGAEDGTTYLHLIGWAPKHGGGAAFLALCEAVAHSAAVVVGANVQNVNVQLREPGVGGELDAENLEQSQHTFVVREGLGRFLIRLGARRDPGLFLDHRPTRQRVVDVADGKRVLNVFGYTGSFSVLAGLAGARRTRTVDLSASTVRWAAENLELNGLSGPQHDIVRADALSYFDDVNAGSWDIIVIDPPSFSKSRSGRPFDVSRDHPTLLRQAATALAAGGQIIFSCNRRGFAVDLGGLNDEFVVDNVTKETTPPDFRGEPHHAFVLRRR
jgi:23S rRNA (guanine2445-N2)-methyltransferase / 23S rRNA (guanine2069-N7)-methyltransferase